MTVHHVRDLRPGDESRWRDLWAGYLTFYETTLPEATTDATWRRLIGPDATFAAIVVEHNGVVVGFANYVLHPFTWSEAPACLLHDLYVDPGVRGGGFGRALIDALIERGKARGWARVYWVTKESNARARVLYDRYAPADGFIRYTVKLS